MHHAPHRMGAMLAALAVSVGLVLAVPAIATAGGTATDTVPTNTNQSWSWVVPRAFGRHHVDGHTQRQFNNSPGHRFTLRRGTARIHFRHFHWSRWRAGRVVGHGQARWCRHGHCTRTHKARIVLSRKRGNLCGEGVEWFFTRYRLHHVPRVPNGTYRSPRARGC